MQSDYCRFWGVVVVFLVVLLNLQSCHKYAVEAARGLPVKFLPGFDGPLPFQLQTGYIGVGQNEEIQLFYYFIKSDSNPQEDPLILWITGGRTCSALRSIFQQIGPLLVEPVEYNGSLPRLQPFPYSWTKVASIIFLDLPAGTGFSYATKSLENGDLSAASNAYEFLQKWLIDHPEFLSNPFYVGGHSYAGYTVPIITEMISNGIESGVKPLIELQGYILGSPRGVDTQSNYRVPFAYGMGLITDQLYESLKENCKGDYTNFNSTNLQCHRDLQTFNQLTESINHNHILEPICLSGSDSTMSSLIKLPVQKPLYHDLYTKLKIDPFFLSELQCRDEWKALSEYWANDYNVQMALHVRQGTKEKWELCNNSVPYTSSVSNALPSHVNLSKKGYRSLIYSGDHEMVSTCLSNEAWIKSLNYSIIDDWRSWMVEGQVAGYTTTYANKMTFVTVKLESCHKHAVEAARGLPVNFLPGFDGPLPFQLQTGYIGVQNEEIQLFYYFVKSDSNPQEDPLILWITGGKTCSALRTIFQQIGPLLVEPVEYNGSLPRLRPFPYSWTKFASIIFLDSPAGTGFSYATKSVQNSDLSAASNAYEFLQKWLIDHPEFLSNPFYVAGHSYAGLIVPIITEMITNGIESGVKPLIQLQGYILGSPRVFEAQDNYRVPFAHGMGLITDQLYESLRKNCKEDYTNTNSTSLHCQRDLQTFNQLTESINHKHILEPICLSGSDSTMSSLIKLPVQKPLYHDLYTKLKIDPFFLSGLQCRDEWSELTPYWANDYHVQMALHVRQGTKEKWELCSDSVPYTSSIGNAIPYHMRLSKKGYRSLIYSGDHEMMSTCLSNEAWIKLLNYSIIDDWRSWMIEGQVAGYTTTYANNMTFVTVKGGGHVAPDYRPFESQVMFERWISYENL